MVRIIGPVAIEIHDEVLFLPGGQIDNWARKLQVAQTRNIRNAAPLNKRTRKFPGNPPRGHLKAMISSEKRMLGTKIIGVDTYSKANYSMFVIGGTHTQYARSTLGTFLPAKGTGFALPRNNYGPFRWRQMVRGQAANNFMLKGMQKTSIAHPSIRAAGHLKQVFPQ